MIHKSYIYIIFLLVFSISFVILPKHAEAWPAAVNIFVKYNSGTPGNDTDDTGVLGIPVSYKSDATDKAYNMIGNNNIVGARTCTKSFCEECADGIRNDGTTHCKTQNSWWAGLSDGKKFTCKKATDPDTIPSAQGICPDGSPACYEQNQASTFVHTTSTPPKCTNDYSDFAQGSIDKTFWELFKMPDGSSGYTMNPAVLSPNSEQRKCSGISSTEFNKYGWTTISGLFGYAFNCACNPIVVTLNLEDTNYTVEKVYTQEMPNTDIRFSCQTSDNGDKCSYTTEIRPNGVITNIYFTLRLRQPTIVINKNESGDDEQSHTWNFDIEKRQADGSYSFAKSAQIDISAPESSGSVAVEMSGVGTYRVVEKDIPEEWRTNQKISGDIVLTETDRIGDTAFTNIYGWCEINSDKPTIIRGNRVTLSWDIPSAATSVKLREERNGYDDVVKNINSEDFNKKSTARMPILDTMFTLIPNKGTSCQIKVKVLSNTSKIDVRPVAPNR